MSPKMRISAPTANDTTLMRIAQSRRDVGRLSRSSMPVSVPAYKLDASG